MSYSHTRSFQAMAEPMRRPEYTEAPPMDESLWIRIPRKKVDNITRQETLQVNWKGRRGKPRCDHCRHNNLKCDRELPICNHCSWANGRECKYTPLPTPAHRGIPRCDRCRSLNLKCDRSLPLCNNCEEAKETDCNYTPKKRNKTPIERLPIRERSLAAAYASAPPPYYHPQQPPDDESDIESESSISVHAPSYAVQSNIGRLPPSYNRDETWDTDPHSSRIMSSHSRALKKPSSSHPISQSQYHHSSNKAPTTSAYGQHPADMHKNAVSTHRERVEPWSDSNFIPLPEPLLHVITSLNVSEMPRRAAFSEAFAAFLADMGPELREVAAFSPQVYTSIWGSVFKDDFGDQPPCVITWTKIHHVRIGSQRYTLLLLPKDIIFQAQPKEEAQLHQKYMSKMDSRRGLADKDPMLDPYRSSSMLEWNTAFERIPVEPQIFDILVYAHREHAKATEMVLEIRQIGFATISWPMAEMFVRLCPVCNHDRSHHHRSHSPTAHYNAPRAEEPQRHNYSVPPPASMPPPPRRRTMSDHPQAWNESAAPPPESASSSIISRPRTHSQSGPGSVVYHSPPAPGPPSSSRHPSSPSQSSHKTYYDTGNNGRSAVPPPRDMATDLYPPMRR